MPTRTFTSPAVKITQRQKSFYLLKTTASVLTKIAYVAERGKSNEQGAVQRLLNRRRISSIKEYTLRGGDYPASIVLNWVNQEHEIRYSDGSLKIPIRSRSAQIIDGQHRVEGIRDAIAEKADIGELELPVTLYSNLGTSECANIFLAINTEQKPVSKSLVYDLYGVASDFLVDYAASRARDIAMSLNEWEDSPYHALVTEPTQRSRRGVSLATIVSAIKPLVATKGTFEQAAITNLEDQTQVIVNFFIALEGKYGSDWESRGNALMYAAGFIGAIEFFKRHLFDYCYRLKSFSVGTISKAIEMDQDNLIEHSEIKGLGGAKAREVVAERLLDMFVPELPNDAIEF